MLRFIRNLIFLDQSLCHVCRREPIGKDLHICQPCIDRLEVLVSSRRPRLAAIDKVYSPFIYNNFLRQLIWRFKFQDQAYLYICLGELISQGLDDFMDQVDLIVSVPMHPKKERLRGYNQSDLLARYLAERYKKAYDKKLVRKLRDTRKQSQLSGPERLKNLRGAFGLEKNLENRSILLVDDLITTGSTLEELAKTLKEAGAGDIRAVTIASVGN